MLLKKIASGWWRVSLIAHRYLGIAMGVVMTMWFLSGIVMMYVAFPHITEVQRVRTLAPISWTACCRFGNEIAAGEPVLGIQVEDVAREPVLRLRRVGKPDTALDLAHGLVMQIDNDRARAIALDAAPRIIGQIAPLAGAEQIQGDQWTFGVPGERPLFRFAFDDPARTNIYVSGAAGQVVHWTTATQRFWNWFGAIPHWFYFGELRRHVVLWSEVLISASILGSFLTALGLYLGVAQFKPAAGISPYRGWHYWHHVTGLVFGLTTLTWVASGLVSMNPWGFLAERLPGEEQRQLEGRMPQWGEVRSSLDTIRMRPEIADAVSIVSAPLGGQLYWLSKWKDGRITRLDAAGNVVAVNETDLADAARRIAGPTPISDQGMLGDEDAYYFRRDDAFVLPVYRVVLNDLDNTRYYIDPKTGVLLQRVDSNGRWYRWLFSGPHRMDFASWMRVRPLRDIIILTLMLGGLSLSGAGVYLAFGRIRKDLGSLFRSVGK
jgi:uncharacterized iron-regulated membrane protein